jgi:predicted nucleic acid-binding protein
MKRPVRVLDSYSLIVYLENERGIEDVIQVFRSARDSNNPVLLSVVNWGEILYVSIRKKGREAAHSIEHLISELPIQIVPADLSLARQAAEFKARGRISYADCFAAALAKVRNAELVTGDKEFRQVEKEVKILWI